METLNVKVSESVLKAIEEEFGHDKDRIMQDVFLGYICDKIDFWEKEAAGYHDEMDIVKEAYGKKFASTGERDEILNLRFETTIAGMNAIGKKLRRYKDMYESIAYANT